MFTHLHTDTAFGLGQLDCQLFGKNKKDEWAQSMLEQMAENSYHILEIQQKVPYNLRE
jgi:hypothetical protein